MWAQMRNHCSGGSRISFLHWVPTSKGEGGGRAPTYHFWPLFPENCMKLKRNVYPPLDPPMVCLIATYKSLLLHVHHVMYFYSPPTKSGVCLSITRERVYHVTITHDVLELTIKRSPPEPHGTGTPPCWHLVAGRYCFQSNVCPSVHGGCDVLEHTIQGPPNLTVLGHHHHHHPDADIRWLLNHIRPVRILLVCFLVNILLSSLVETRWFSD